MPEELNIAVFGAGTFGRNHLRVYRQVEQSGARVKVSAIVEPDPERASGMGEPSGASAFRTVEELLACRRAGKIGVDAASIAAPTSRHYELASACLEDGIDVLVEKPVCATVDEAESLERLAAAHDRILQVGHVERFNPAVAAAESLLHRPMFFEAHRLSVFTQRSLDVDVVLDLMIHDLDIVLKFARSPVRSVHAVGLPILSTKVDIANVRVEFESGAVANFTASRVSTEKVRKLRFFQPRQYISIDYARQDLLVVNVERDAARQPSSGLVFTKPPVESGEPLRLEIEAFLRAVRSRAIPRVTAREGRDALALSLEITRKIEEHAARARLGDMAG